VPIDQVLDTLGLTNGRHHLVVTTSDEARYTVNGSLSFVVENSIPTINIITPTEGLHVRGTVPVQFSVIEGQGLKALNASVNGKPVGFQKGIDGLYTFDIDTLALGITEEGLTITISSENLVGTKATVERKVLVDNKPPVITVTAGSGGDLMIKAKFTDGNKIGNAWVRIDGSDWKEMNRDGDNDYSFMWRTTDKDNGVHTIEVKGVDSVGNEGRQTQSIKVKNTISTSASSPLNLLLFVVVVVLAIALVAALLMKRKKKEEAAPIHEGRHEYTDAPVTKSHVPKAAPPPPAVEPPVEVDAVNLTSRNSETVQGVSEAEMPTEGNTVPKQKVAKIYNLIGKPESPS